MKDITFKQVLQYLREVEHEHGHIGFVLDLIEKRMKGYVKTEYLSLIDSQKQLLDKLGLTYKFKEDIQEWEINLIDDE